jgi:hypothetical protein
MLRARLFVVGLTLRMAVILLMLMAAAPLLARQPRVAPEIATGTSTIRGRVIDSVTKAPVAGCSIRITTSGGLAQRVTDLAGTYELKDVAAGTYALMPIECPGYLRSCFGGYTPEGAPLCSTVDIARDQQRDSVDVSVIPGAIARGQVMTFDGKPATRASVRLGRGMKGEPTFMVTPVTTDTEGRFELINLPAGEWRLEVEIPPVPGGLRPPIVYYPGGLSWEDAVGVKLTAGKVTDRLTITVPRINENALTVIVPPPDATIDDIAVSVLRESPLITQRLEVNSEGIARLKGVVPGRYFAWARAASRDKRWAAFEVIDFIEDNYEARLHLMPTGSIAGRIVTDKGDPPPLGGVMVGASWVYDGVEVNPLDFDETPAGLDGSFRIDNLFGTRKLQLRGLDVDWDVAAIRQDRTDVTSSGVVVISDATTPATIVLRKR